MKEFIFRKYRPEDKEQVLSLLGAALWDFPYEERLAYFNWKYELNPYTESPLGFVCLDEEKIVSFRGYMKQPLMIGGRIMYSVASGDTVTASDYRRKGIFSRLTRFSILELEKESQTLIVTNSSSGWATSIGCQKLGWFPLTRRGHLFSFSWRSFFSKKDVPSVMISKKGDIRIELSTECRVVDMANLSLKQKNKNLIELYTDEEYIAWRYSNPHSKYLYVYYNQGEELQSFLVLKVIAEHKYDLVDYQYKEKDQLLILLKKVHQWLNPLYLIHWLVNKNGIITQYPNQYGFINLNFILNRFSKFRFPPFLVRTTHACQCEKDWQIVGAKDIRDVANWNINKIIADEI